MVSIPVMKVRDTNHIFFSYLYHHATNVERESSRSMKPDPEESRTEVREMIEGCLQNDRHAQKLVYEKYSGKLFGVCLAYSYDRYEAEDTLHDGFIKIFSNIRQYKGDGSFEGWMRKIMVNTALEKYRRNHKMMNIADQIRSITEDSVDHILDEISASEIREEVMKLTPQYRMVFLLFAVEGYSHKEIGNMLNISEGTSKSNLSRARTVLQERLKHLYDKNQEEIIILPMIQPVHVQ